MDAKNQKLELNGENRKERGTVGSQGILCPREYEVENGRRLRREK